MSQTVSAKKRKADLFVTGSLSNTPNHLNTNANKFIVQDGNVFKYRTKQEEQNDLEILPTLKVGSESELDNAFTILNENGYGNILVTGSFFLTENKTYDFTNIRIKCDQRKTITFNGYVITGSAGNPYFENLALYGQPSGTSMAGADCESMFCSSGSVNWMFHDISWGNVVGTIKPGDPPVINIASGSEWQTLVFDSNKVSSEGVDDFVGFSISITDPSPTHLYVFVSNQLIDARINSSSLSYDLYGPVPSSYACFQSDASVTLKNNPGYTVKNIINTKNYLASPRPASDKLLVEDTLDNSLKYVFIDDITSGTGTSGYSGYSGYSGQDGASFTGVENEIAYFDSAGDITGSQHLKIEPGNALRVSDDVIVSGSTVKIRAEADGDAVLIFGDSSVNEWQHYWDQSENNYYLLQGNLISGDIRAYITDNSFTIGHYLEPAGYAQWAKLTVNSSNVIGSIVMQISGSTIFNVVKTAAAAQFYMGINEVGVAQTYISLNTATNQINFVSDATTALAIGSSGITLESGTNINEFSTDGTMVGNSDDAVPTEQAVVEFVHSQTGSFGEQGTANGQLLFWNNSSKKWLHTETNEFYFGDTDKNVIIGGGLVVNENSGGGANDDFRAESNSTTNALLVDASANRVDTNVTTRIGGPSSNNYTNFSTTGHQTMVNGAEAAQAVWKTPMEVYIPTGDPAPSLGVYNTSSYGVTFPAGSSTYVYMNFIMPYFKSDYNYDVRWYCLWTTTTNESGEDVGITCDWNWTDPGELFSSPAQTVDGVYTLTGNEAGRLMLTGGGVPFPASHLGPDSLLQVKWGRVTRIDTHAYDIVVFGWGLHFNATQIGNTSGSHTTYP